VVKQKENWGKDTLMHGIERKEVRKERRKFVAPNKTFIGAALYSGAGISHREGNSYKEECRL
jgi:hypothetical protein